MNFLSEMNDRKERKKVEKNEIKTNVLVPKTNVIRKEEGATVDVLVGHFVTYLLSAGRFEFFRRAVRQ